MAGYVELIIDQGTSFSNVIDLTDDAGVAINLASYLVAGQIRKWYTSSNSAATFAIGVIDAANGTIEMTLDAPTTSNIKMGRYVFDVVMKDTTSNNVTRVIEGIVNVTPTATTNTNW